MGLSGLPQPKNDFEIVVPESADDPESDQAAGSSSWVQDQEEIDQQTAEEFRKRKEAEFKRRSQAVQRSLPRPTDMNHTMLMDLATLNSLNVKTNDLAKDRERELQMADELIKREMIVMMHHDCIETPTPSQMGEGAGSSKKKKASAGGDRSILNEAGHRAYLDRHPYENFDDDDIANAKEILAKEMEAVKSERGEHGELSLEAYSQVWEECLAEVFYWPSKNRYTRKKYVNNKDRIKCFEKRLQQNRSHMTREANRAVKIENKLKILTKGYQTRAQGLSKQVQDLNEQIEQATLELSTFKFLDKQEGAAIPQRLQSLMDDVSRQKDRERELQKDFASLHYTLQNMHEQNGST